MRNTFKWHCMFVSLGIETTLYKYMLAPLMKIPNTKFMITLQARSQGVCKGCLSMTSGPKVSKTVQTGYI